MLLVLFVLLVGFVLLWFFVLRPWPFGLDPDSVQGRLERTTAALLDYGERTEARLRLQLLGGDMDDGRRSEYLRPDYQQVEQIIDRVADRASGPAAVELQVQADGLLADLSRDRSSARARVGNLVDLLSYTAGPGRQGDLP